MLSGRGYNGSGGLGDGTHTDSSVHVQAEAATNWVMIDDDGSHTIGIARSARERDRRRLRRHTLLRDPGRCGVGDPTTTASSATQRPTTGTPPSA